MRMVFTGGGTGGHIFPNIAIIRELKKCQGKSPSLKAPDIFYIGEKGGMEEELLAKEKVHFFGIHAGKMRRYFSMKNFVDALKVPLGLLESLRILLTVKPGLVFSKGGYVSVPVACAAYLLKIPLWIHESDLSPGIATKITSHFATKIFLSFEESRTFFPKKKTVVVGNPVRAQILQGEAEKGFDFTAFSRDRPVVLFMGGSSGAASLNAHIFKILPRLLKVAQVIHITGSPLPPKAAAVHSHSYRAFTFINEQLADCYAMADVVVSRAGSGSIFELLVIRRPMVLVPLSRDASRGDQIENARLLEKHGCAVVLKEEIASSQQLFTTINELLHNKEQRARMMAAQKQYGGNAAEIIAAEMLNKFINY